ncbi:MAG: hypothetical protein IT290_11430 [Deltaproteobacteria bacterium]|nr:hypothetical protein [Deltaproteobacteria bacterium]
MRILTFLFSASLCGLYLSSSLRDPDLGWHVVVGRWILANATVPTVDHWTMFAHGQPWVAYSWLPEVVFAAVDRGFSASGLYFLQMTLALALSFVSYFVYSALSRNMLVGGLLGALVTISTFSHFGLRPQSLVWIYLLLTVGLCARIEDRGLKRFECCGLLVLFSLWANTHTSTLFGLVTVGLWLLSSRGSRIALTAGALSFSGTLVTPYFGREWLVFLNIAGHPSSFSSIAEFRSPMLAQYQSAFPILLFALLIVIALPQWRRVEPSKALLIVGMLAGGALVSKLLPFANVLCAALLAQLWQGSGGLNGISDGIERVHERASRAHLVPLLLFIAIAHGVILAQLALLPRFDPLSLPVEAMNFAEVEQLPGVVAHDFQSGGYLLYRMSDASGIPAQRAMMDGRTNLISEELWSKHQSAIYGEDGWRDYFELVPTATIVWNKLSPLTPKLREDPEWCKVFENGLAGRGYAVFVRRETGRCPAA